MKTYFNRLKTNALTILVVVATVLLGTSQMWAQVAGASLTGTIRDASGAVMPDVQVSITNVATGITRQVTTDRSGLYIAPNLLPGTYEVSATAQGFSKELQRNVLLTVGAQQLLDFTMRVGRVTNEVVVTDEAPQVQLTSSTMSEEVNATTVRELPLNGRSWTDLANLQPGVVGVTAHTTDTARGFGGQVSISGNRPQGNNYRIDGVSINDYSNGGPGSILGGNLGVDAIREFSVLTSNYSAEYGKTSGGVVNAITRSGTNDFHGSVYEFLRNSALDARNYFDQTKPPFKRNQFGVAAGGPIKRDKSFIFGDFEAIRQSLGITNISTVLSPAARSGNLSTGTVPVDPNVAAFLALEPLPNAGLLGSGDIGEFSFAGQQVVNENYATLRADETLSDKDSLFGTYSYDNSPQTQPDALHNALTAELAKRQIAALEETHLYSPTFVNTVRLGYNRDHTDTPISTKFFNSAATNPSLMWSPTVGSPARTTAFGGLSAISVLPTTPAYKFVWNAYQVYDDASASKGLHSIKFGGAFENDQMNQLTTGGSYVGIFSFKSLADFLQNQPHSVSGVLPSALNPRYMRTSIFGAYVQDDWRFRSNLTLNLGMRYEMSTVPSEINGRITNLPTISAATPRLGGPFFRNPTLRDFAPRVGFAWDPFQTGKTAVRGGFGIFDVVPLLYTTITLNGLGAPFFNVASSTSLPQGSFPNTAINDVNKSTLQNVYVDSKPKRDYVMQWNLNIQQQITPSVTAVVAYVGSHGVHQLFRIDDANFVLPTHTSAGYVWPNPIGSGTLVNPNVGEIRYVNWDGSSLYDALQTALQKRMAHGLQFQASFTWSKSIDDNSGAIAGDTLGNSITSMFWPNLAVTRGVSDFNIPRVLVANGIWDIPSSHAGGPLRWGANGWELGSIFRVQDGIPLTPTFGSGADPLGLNSTDPFDFPDVVRGPGCSSPVNPGNPLHYIKTQCFAVPTAPNQAFYNQYCDPTVGNPALLQCFNLMGNARRNSIVGPGLQNLDFSVFKNNRVKIISEDLQVQFRAEIFNILNRANFSAPIPGQSVSTANNIFTATGSVDPTAGLITSTVTTSREIQFGLKVNW